MAGGAPERLAARPPSAGGRIAGNAAANAVGAVVPALVMLALVPYVLRTIGADGYGVWALIGTLVGVAQLADFGMTGAVTRQVAFLHGSNDSGGVAEVVHSGTVVFLIVALALVLVALLAWEPLRLAYFAGVGDRYGDLRRLYLGCALVFGGTLATAAYGGLLDGLQRMGVQAVVRVGAVLANALTVVLALRAGHGLFALLEGSVAGLAFRAVALLAAAAVLLPESVRLPLRVTRGRVAALARFSSKVSVVQVSGFAHYHVVKLFLGMYAPLGAVGLYDVASAQMLRLQSVLTGVVYPFLPALAGAAARGDARARVEGVALYALAHRLLAALVVPFLVALLALSGPFVALWLGLGFGAVAPVLIWAGVGTGALILTAPAHYLLMGYGTMRADVERSVLGVVLVVAGGLLAARTGDVVLATAVNSAAAVGALVCLYARARSAPVIAAAGWGVLVPYGRVLLACAPGGVLAYALGPSLGRTWPGFAALAIGFLASAAALARVTGVVTPAEVAKAFRRVRGVPAPGAAPSAAADPTSGAEAGTRWP